MYSPHIERVYILLDLGMPEAWAESYAHLYHSAKPPVFTDRQWWQLKIDAGMFWDRWGVRVVGMDWLPADVRNLFPKIRGRPVVAVGHGDVTLGDGEQVFKRPVLGKAPVWQERGRAA